MYRTVQRQLIIWTSVLVGALGVVVAGSCLQPPAAGDSLFVSQAYARKHKSSRTIASSFKPSSERAKEEPTPRAVRLAISDGKLAQAIEVKIGCSGPQTGTFDDSVNQMRFSGKVCATGEEISSSEIRNEANGTSATVFFPTPTSFTTDYVALAPGQNRIRILNFLKNGLKEERAFVVERSATQKM